MTADPLVLAIDASTTACKAIVFDLEGNAVSQGRAPIALDNPAPDAYEQDAEEWWAATLSALRQAIDALGSKRAAALAAVTITHQRESFVITDRDFRPLRPALVWMDARCRKQVEVAKERLSAERLLAISGKPPCTTPSFYKLAFVLDQEPSLRARNPLILDVFAFLSARLTGRAATSLASADPLGMVDMRARRWSGELLEFLGLDYENVPELVAPGERVATIDASVARAIGLPRPLPLFASAGDGQTAGLGAGIVAPGRAYLNLGTAIVSGVLASDYRTDAAFRTLYGASPGTFFYETDLKGGTFTLNWLVSKWLRHAGDSRSDAQLLSALEAEAEHLPPGSDGLLLVPYWNGVMNPYWDDNATGMTVGWHGAHGPAHLYRAILEGIAFEQRLHSAGVELATGTIDEFVVMGGGAQSELWCQILADVLARPIVRAATPEASALGAAILATVSAGLHPDVEGAVRAMTRTAERFVSGPSRTLYRELYERAYVGIYRKLASELAALAELRASAAKMSH